MSWILAVLSALPGAPDPASSPSGHRVQAGCLRVSADGPAATCLHGLLPEGSAWKGFVVAGVGLVREERVRTLAASDWAQRLSAPQPRLGDLDGHFVALRWRDDAFEAFTDRAGLRPAFLSQSPGGIFFSTHLERLLAARGGGTLDVARLGSAWLLHNQVVPASLVREAVRLQPGTGVVVQDGSFTLQGAPWVPVPSGERMESVLRAHLSPVLPEGRRVSLGLSGGLDSRLLLALAPHVPALHVFGPPDHPDARMARRLAAQLGQTVESLHDPLPDADTSILLAARFAADAQFVAAASAALKRRYYARLDADGFAVIDGGFGEIGRRRFLNRALLLGRSALRDGRFEALAPYLRMSRPGVFSAAAREQMERGVMEDLQALAASVLCSPDRSLENVLDRCAISMLPNLCGFEQARLDAEALCLMPYAQPSFLEAVLGTAPAERRGGRQYRRLIRAFNPALARFPLVKGTQPHPFGLGPVGAAAWTRLSRRFQPYASEGPHAFLARVEPFVRDHVRSRALRECGLYHTPALDRLVDGYYDGNAALAAHLDGWLAFELWRSEVGL